MNALEICARCIGEDGGKDRLGGQDGIGRMHAILVLLASTTRPPFEDFILSTLYNQLYRSCLDKSVPIYLIVVVISSSTIYIYIVVCVCVCVSRSMIFHANFFAFFFFFSFFLTR